MLCGTQESRKIHGRAEKPLSMEEKRLEEVQSAQYSRKMLGRAEKCPAQKKKGLSIVEQEVQGPWRSA